jgi:hypothetical protein
MVPYIPLSMHFISLDLFFQALSMIVSFCRLRKIGRCGESEGISQITHKATFELSQFSILETVMFGQNAGDLRPIKSLSLSNESLRASLRHGAIV